VELHPVELEQQVVRELDVGLVDLVDQHDRRASAANASQSSPRRM
jgi:hypothetical protein